MLIKLSKNGQSLIEYSIILTLLIASIIFVGPMMLRNINAHFKLWDEAAYDSLSEHPKDDAAFDCDDTGADKNRENCSCTCSGWQETEGQRCGVGACGPTEHLALKTCEPLGCDLAAGIATQRCVPDASCCDVIVSADPPANQDYRCGTVRPSQCAGPRVNKDGEPCDPSIEHCLPCDGTETGECKIGEQMFQTLCGVVPTRDANGNIIQVPDADRTVNLCQEAGDCVPSCIGSLGITTQACPGATADLAEAGVAYSQPFSIVGNNDSTCTGAKCEGYCTNGHMKFGDQCIVPCGRTQVAAYNNTAEAAGGTRTFTSEFFVQPITFVIEMWTDDLIFDITFKDAANATVLQESCGNLTHGTTPTGCGEDADTSLNHYTITFEANQVSFTLTEAGNHTTQQFGYRVSIEQSCCEMVDRHTPWPGTPSPLSLGYGESYGPSKLTADYLCQLAGFIDSASHGNQGWDSCGDNTAYTWNGSSWSSGGCSYMHSVVCRDQVEVCECPAIGHMNENNFVQSCPAGTWHNDGCPTGYINILGDPSIVGP